MNIKDAIEQRVSIRNFTDEAVPRSVITELVRRAGLAPSVNNYQPWKFLAIQKKELLNQMATIVSAKIKSLPANQSIAAKNVKSQVEWFATFFQEAPAVIALTMEGYESVLEKGVALSHKDINEARNHPDIQSAGAAIQNMLLSAVDLGYGACWMSAPLMAKEALEELLPMEKNYQLVAFVALGKPARKLSPKPKKPLEEILTFVE
ncbi:MAG: nitroreductase family protein [Bacteroidales bacterium]|jgi:nitroreductase